MRQKHRDPRALLAGKAALDKLVLAHQPLVRSLAAKWFRLNSSYVDFDDLLSAGNEGLLVALDRFKVESPSRLCTYARWWIVNKILHHVRNERPTHISDHMPQVRACLQQSNAKIDKLYREPHREEIVHEMGISIERLNRIDQCRQQEVFSLDIPVGDGESTIGDFIEDRWTSRPDETVLDAVRQSAIKELLVTLSPREEKVIRLRYGVGCEKAYTDGEIAIEFDVTENRIRSIGKSGLLKLQSRCAGTPLR